MVSIFLTKHSTQRLAFSSRTYVNKKSTLPLFLYMDLEVRKAWKHNRRQIKVSVEFILVPANCSPMRCRFTRNMYPLSTPKLHRFRWTTFLQNNCSMRWFSIKYDHRRQHVYQNCLLFSSSDVCIEYNVYMPLNPDRAFSHLESRYAKTS